MPFIALHGWLDNCASFDCLTPYLSNIQCLAIDLAGHGASDHYPGLIDYPLWSEVGAIYAIADQMGWQRFGVIGHSRGAMMALCLAGVYPERISHLLMLDALLPSLIRPEEAPQRMISSIEEVQRRVRRKISLYPSYNEAITARCQSRFSPLSKASAELLAVRGLVEVNSKFHWHADGKLWALSNLGVTKEILDSFVTRITAKCVLLLGENGLMQQLKTQPVALAQHQQIVKQLNIDVHTISGGHFLHMEESVQAVAQLVNDVTK